MSSAQHGYVDPSSADKDAADEIDEVVLQMLCLTGEGVALSVPHSMLGHDLRRLMSQKFPCKPRATLAVHHANEKLVLDQTLEQQGIGKSTLLSCTYIPTNLYAAWCYVRGFRTCEREFALEGVTQLEKVMCGEHLHHLPCSLAKLSFGHEFNQDLAHVTLPSSLQNLCFGFEFNQSLEQVTLPSSLQSLSFGNQFNFN